MQMKRRAFLAGAAALAASPALPVSPVVAGEWWTPGILSSAGEVLAMDAAWTQTAIQRIFSGQMSAMVTTTAFNSGECEDDESDVDYYDEE